MYNPAKAQANDALLLKLHGNWMLIKSFRIEKTDTIDMGPLMVAIGRPPFDGPMSLFVDSLLNFRIQQSSGGVPMNPYVGKVLIGKRNINPTETAYYLTFQDGDSDYKRLTSLQDASFLSGYVLNITADTLQLKNEMSTERIFKRMAGVQ